jgi:hypothetical protein
MFVTPIPILLLFGWLCLTENVHLDVVLTEEDAVTAALVFIPRETIPCEMACNPMAASLLSSRRLTVRG